MGAELVSVGDISASSSMLADTVGRIQSFVDVFVEVYILLIFVYIILQLVRLPYSPWLNRVQRFLFDVCDPYLRLFRRIIPPLGPLDLSPMVGVIVLLVFRTVAHGLLGRLH
ncbi:MAG: YggT family protein [Gaiellaceae bacterium]|nr:YggT family protein [Gaiellaceae bacterium]